MKIPLIKYEGMENQKYFIFKVLLFILLVILLDFGIGSILRYYYFRQHSGFLYRTTYAMDKTTADILILGASTANHQYDPEIFEKGLNMSCYNAGRDGSNIFYHYAILKAALKRYSPKIIILEMRGELAKTTDSYDRLSMLLPYYESHPEIRQIIKPKSPFEKIKMLSKIYPYNSMLFSIAVGNFKHNALRFNDNKGYLPLNRIWDEPLEMISKPLYSQLDTNKIKTYESIIKECISANVKLYIVSSPNFYKTKYVENSDVKAKEIAEKYNIKFLDYSQDSVFLANSNYFVDIHHLNSSGATVLSNRVVGEIERDYITAGKQH
jgi:hypothetical protein